jgi:hypothetical protein
VNKSHPLRDDSYATELALTLLYYRILIDARPNLRKRKKFAIIDTDLRTIFANTATDMMKSALQPKYVKYSILQITYLID